MESPYHAQVWEYPLWGVMIKKDQYLRASHVYHIIVLMYGNGITFI